MDKQAYPGPARWLLQRPQLLLAGHLLIVHVLVFGLQASLEARLILWPMAMGLFLLWQPLVAGGQRLGLFQTLALVLLVCLWALVLNPWLLLLWCATLAALIAGRGLRLGGGRHRLGLLLAFAYLLCLMMLGLIPLLPRDPALLGALPREAFAWWLPLLPGCLLLLPGSREDCEQPVDFIHSLLIFLLLAVFMLGSLAVTFLDGQGYGWSLFITSMSLGGGLLLLAWAWNPRAGFAGIGAALGRYLLSLGMPMEAWVCWLSEASERSDDPEAFLEAALGRLQQLPWITGVSWQGPDGAGSQGVKGLGRQRCCAAGLCLELHFRQPPGAVLRWHCDWLLRLLLAFYQVKRQARELQLLNYEKAIHETGARVTHDVKNILQALQNLCYAAGQGGDSAALGRLIQRQLPALAERLQGTLGRLQQPRAQPPGGWLPVRAWWQARQAAQGETGISCQAPAEALEQAGAMPVPGELFDSVLENLLDNARAKSRREPGLHIRLRLVHREGWGLEVEDDGSPVPAALARKLVLAPVPSEDGLGIGLYQGGRQAALGGYRLELQCNEPGRVVFALVPAAGPGTSPA